MLCYRSKADDAAGPPASGFEGMTCDLWAPQQGTRDELHKLFWEVDLMTFDLGGQPPSWV